MSLSGGRQGEKKKNNVCPQGDPPVADGSSYLCTVPIRGPSHLKAGYDTRCIKDGNMGKIFCIKHVNFGR
jgi:hypothetical protein